MPRPSNYNGHETVAMPEPAPGTRKTDRRTQIKINRALVRVPSISLDKELAISNSRKETVKAHAAFLVFCNLGPHRTLPMLVKELGKHTQYVRQLQRWSAQFGWFARAKQYDRDVFEEKRRKEELAIEAMNDVQAGIALNQLRKMIEQVDRLISSGKFGAMATVQHIKNMLDIERTARGAPNDRTRIELTGEDGGPIQTDTTQKVLLYLPKKEEIIVPPGGE